MKTPSNHDLHIMITRLEGKMDNVGEKLDTVIEGHGNHLATIDGKISKLNTLAAFVGLTCAGIGVVIGSVKDKILSTLLG